MNYGLGTFGSRVLVEIDEASFIATRNAKHALVKMIGIEQKFDLLLENYADYERELLELRLRRSLRIDHEWASFQDDIAAVARRLANLLSAARLFLDQVKHDLSSTFGHDSQICEAIERKTSEQFDSRFGYRFPKS